MKQVSVNDGKRIGLGRTANNQSKYGNRIDKVKELSTNFHKTINSSHSIHRLNGFVSETRIPPVFICWIIIEAFGKY